MLATRRQGWRGLVGRTNGGMIVHLGVLMIGVAIAASGSYQTERDVRMCVEAEEGCPSTVTVDGHTITYLGSTTNVAANRTDVGARLRIDGVVHEPALQRFVNGSNEIGKPSVKNSVTDSVMVTITDTPTDTGSVAIKVIVQPLIVWLWAGGGVMAFGSVLAAFPGQRRRPEDPVSAPVPDAEADPVDAGSDGAGGPDDERVPAGAGSPS